MIFNKKKIGGHGKSKFRMSRRLRNSLLSKIGRSLERTPQKKRRMVATAIARLTHPFEVYKVPVLFVSEPSPENDAYKMSTKAVRFASTASVVEIPSRCHYSSHARMRMWSSHRVIRKTARRNAIEYWNDTLGMHERWRECVEEEQMMTLRGKLLHPRTYRRVKGIELCTNIALLGLPVLFDLYFGIWKYEQKIRSIDYGDRRPQPRKKEELGTAFLTKPPPRLI
ncbi:expressed unknown protein [Seminavis robusta]|uniref:Uncharacterized protein n=1 Tax=Seminavis robusta TaxID=568900 RepID=A0A9N8H1B5_9STRA|nr:expressed unknown protein [Seminavis robusta]|eukprot:Sro37_g023300.1 n/a (225) ;mRNA; r:100400-101074